MIDARIVATTDFETGNGHVVLDGQRVHVDRDLRDSVGDRWYWHVRLVVDRATRVRVHPARPGIVGSFGPALRRRGPYDWLVQGPCAVDADEFELVLPPGATYLAATLPYGRADLRHFRRRLAGVIERWWVIARTELGRQVPAFTVGSDAAGRLIVLTARHHACESTASLVLEGAVEEFARLRGRGHTSVRDRQLLVVPMVDTDGVVAGDQGKARSPWDPNRDYAATGSRYAAVRGLRRLLRDEVRPTAALDLHTPGLRGAIEEVPYVVSSGDSIDRDAATRLSDAIGRRTPRHAAPDLLQLGDDWNSAGTGGQRGFAAWMRSRPSTTLALTLEYPNAAVRGVAINPRRARAYGAATMVGLLESL